MAKAAQSAGEVMAALSHPLRAEADALRVILLALKAPKLDESVKWNAPSYAVGGVHCVTFNFSDKKSIRLIFHCDTARKETKGAPPAFADETGLLAWQSDIRAIAVFRTMEDVAAAKLVLPGLVRRWVSEVVER
ncbi:DUF1801 domain-containing protein [Hyphomonas sp.]|uniref:DUF1801 domain-containing protein n=1 Tax=Hyphomonas sp. TaxID=87 RepID=UPI003919D45F